MGAAQGAIPRKFWVDPRFAVGILLIVASVVGVCGLLAAQNRSVQVYVAHRTLVAGDTVRVSDLELASVRVPASDHYLTAGALPSDAVVVRSVPQGELVPASAVSSKTDAALTSVVVKASGPVAASVVTGSTVDVWAAHAVNDKAYKPPVVLVTGAVVVSVAHDDALVTDCGAVAVEVRVLASRVASVLQAIADGQVLSVVPTSAGAAVSATPVSPSATPTPTDTRTLDDSGSADGSDR